MKLLCKLENFQVDSVFTLSHVLPLQTNIGHNNNKFYLLQLLEDDSRKSYNVWFRWGRVGKTGQSNLTACGPDLNEAKKVFCTK